MQAHTINTQAAYSTHKKLTQTNTQATDNKEKCAANCFQLQHWNVDTHKPPSYNDTTEVLRVIISILKDVG